MYRFMDVKKYFIFDAVFALLLIIFYTPFYFSLSVIRSDVNSLFLATYTFLGLGALVLYLLHDMNPKLSLSIHTGFFPFLSLVFIFSRWLPDILIMNFNGIISPLTISVLIYTLIMIAYFISHLFIQKRDYESIKQGGRKGLS